MQGIEPAIVISLIGLIVSFSSFCLSAGSLRISHLNRQLSLNQEERKLPKTVVENLRNFTGEDGEQTYFVTLLSLINISENANSVKSAELVIHFSANTGNPALRLDPTNSEAKILERFRERIKVPSQITGNNTLHGWLVFQAPSSFINGKNIKQIDLELGDIHAKIEPIKDLIFLRNQ